MQKYKIISIEGNIGSGKSTLFQELQNYYKNNPNVVFLQEPVELWEQIKDDNNETMLTKFYNNQEKYSFAFQIMAFNTRCKILKNAINAIKTTNQEKETIIITERCLYTDKCVFAKMLANRGDMEDVMYQIYLNMFNDFNEYTTNKIVYICTNPEECLRRIKKRQRQGEDKISQEYLNTCHYYHEEYIYDNKINKEIIVLDGNQDILINPQIMIGWIQTVHSFIM